MSYFYGDWITADKKSLARDLFGMHFYYLDSWLKCITVLRNKCAHYSRLYYALFTDKPRIPDSIQYECNGRIFDQLLMLKFLYTHKHNWNTSLVLPLETLISEYYDVIDYKHIGFPNNWKELLEYKEKTITGIIE